MSQLVSVAWMLCRWYPHLLWVLGTDGAGAGQNLAGELIVPKSKRAPRMRLSQHVKWCLTSFPLERLIQGQPLTDNPISSAQGSILLRKRAGRRERWTALVLPAGEVRHLETFIRQKTDWRYCLTV